MSELRLIPKQNSPPSHPQPKLRFGANLTKDSYSAFKLCSTEVFSAKDQSSIMALNIFKVSEK